jgi:CheY-like chemotaxis protein
LLPKEILIVDDNAINLSLLRVLLELEGSHVYMALNAEEALARFECMRPELILMDLQLPGMDGLELTRKLKAEAPTSDIPIVAITSYAMKGDEERAAAAGCDGYITKPIDTRTIVDTLCEIIRAAEARRKL